MAYFLITLYPNYLLNADYHTGKTVVFPLTNQFNFLTCKLPKDFCFWQTFKYPFQCLSHLRKFLSFTHTEDFFKLLNLKEHFYPGTEQSFIPCFFCLNSGVLSWVLFSPIYWFLFYLQQILSIV